MCTQVKKHTNSHTETHTHTHLRPHGRSKCLRCPAVGTRRLHDGVVLHPATVETQAHIQYKSTATLLCVGSWLEKLPSAHTSKQNIQTLTSTSTPFLTNTHTPRACARTYLRNSQPSSHTRAMRERVEGGTPAPTERERRKLPSSTRLHKHTSERVNATLTVIYRYTCLVAPT